MQSKCGNCKYAGFISLFDTDIDEYIINGYLSGEEYAPLICEWKPDKLPSSWELVQREVLPINTESGKECPCWEERIKL